MNIRFDYPNPGFVIGAIAFGKAICLMAFTFLYVPRFHCYANPLIDYTLQNEVAWKRVDFVAQDIEHLEEGMRRLSLGNQQPAAIALHMLSSYGIVLSVNVHLDRSENPERASVIVTDGGILDDDLLGVRHVLTLCRMPAPSEIQGQKASSEAWSIIGYSKGMLRREHVASLSVAEKHH